MKFILKSLPAATILAILLSVLPPSSPAYADSSHTWDSKADFDAGVLTNVDTSSVPGDVMLAVNLDTGTGAFDDPDVTGDTFKTDWRKGAVTQKSNSGSNIVYVDTPAGRFYDVDEVLIIQMTGTFTVSAFAPSGILLFISMAMVLSSLLLALLYIWRKRQLE